MEPHAQPTDEALAADAQGGSAAAFELLVKRYQSRLMGFLLRSLNRADAEDVTQDAFVQAYVNITRYSPKWRFKTWLFIIAQRLMIDRLRQRKQKSEHLLEHESQSAGPSDLSEQRDWSNHLWAVAKQRLDDEPFRALWLHYAEDMNTREIARVMNRSWVWVKTALHRARKTLAPHLAKLNIETPATELKAGEPCRIN